MKSIVFDAGPVISLSMNSLLWLLAPLRKKFNGDFYISEDVRKELVERPMEIKRFEFEALQIQGEIDTNVLRVVSGEKIDAVSRELGRFANSSFIAKGTQLKIVHPGEISTLASVIALESESAVIDERTTRLLVESPERIAKHMQDKLHTKVTINYPALKELQKRIGRIKVIRSVELVAVAYEMGLLDVYINKINNPSKEVRKQLLGAVLWGVKLDGCAVSEKEIRQIVKMLG